MSKVQKRVLAVWDNSLLYGELGRTSLKSRRAVNVIKDWLTIVQLDNTKFVKSFCVCLYRIEILV